MGNVNSALSAPVSAAHADGDASEFDACAATFDTIAASLEHNDEFLNARTPCVTRI